MGGIPVPPHPTQPQRVRAGPRGCRGRLCSLRSPTTPELRGAGSFPDGSPAPASPHPAGARGCTRAAPRRPHPTQTPVRGSREVLYVCIYLSVCTYIYATPRFFFHPQKKKAPARPIPTPCALTSGTASTRGRLPPFPPSEPQAGGAPGVPEDQDQPWGPPVCVSLPYAHSYLWARQQWVSIPLLSA